MSYEKQTWTTGDTITAEKLNHMENGIENNGPLVVNATTSNEVVTLDKTWQEIYDAFPNVCVIARLSSTEYFKVPLATIGCEGNVYGIQIGGMFSQPFSSNSPNDYPSNGNNDDDDDSGNENPK